ncbi:Protein DEFECTIVE IN EXINE FORMATION 1 [Balamuthia mandrillaris]
MRLLLLRPARCCQGSVAPLLLVVVALAASLVGVVDGQRPTDLNNKWRGKEAVQPEDILFSTKALSSERCFVDVDLIWQSKLGSAIYASPLIHDLQNDGEQEIVIATADHYVEVIKGADGTKAAGFPFAFAKSNFQASPLLFDRNGDGQAEIVVTTSNAEIVFIRQNGIPVAGETLKVPELRVRRDWYQGLEGKDMAATFALHGQSAKEWQPPSPSGVATPTNTAGRKLLFREPEAEEDEEQFVEMGKDAIWQGMEGWLPPEGVESLQLFLTTNTPRSYVESVSYERDPLFSPQYNKHLKQRQDDPAFLYVDAHILATPVIADIDGDGAPELIVSVSYFFDSEEYSDPQKLATLGTDVSIAKYVAGGIVVFDLQARSIKWAVPLDLTTDHTLYRAHIYAPPTVADLDGDGNLDIIVGTAVGFIYVINHRGELNFDGFPQMMDSIYSQVVVEDVNGDGRLELIATDINSNIACFDTFGTELWENRFFGIANQPPSLADVDGNGVLDVVLTSDAGQIWAFAGDTGSLLPNFPILVEGRTYAKPLLLPLTSGAGSAPERMHIVVTSSNGYLYIIDGVSGCVDHVDLGEYSYGMVLANDLTGNGRLELLVAGKNGNVFCLGISATYHPLKTWNSDTRSIAAYEWHGVYIDEHGHRDVSGDSFLLNFAIVDNRLRRERAENVRYKADFYLRGQRVLKAEYSEPGEYSVWLPCPNFVLHHASVSVVVTNELGQVMEDSIAVSCNAHFTKMMKWVIVVPFVVSAAVLLLLHELKTPLPIRQTKSLREQS